MGGEAAGRARSQYLCYEVESLENHRVGDRTQFKGSMVYVCAKKCRVRRGELEFLYVLSTPGWTGTCRRGNRSFSGLSLLGTVQGCSNETVQLKLDIDGGYPEQALYPWKWVPATGNVMYLMPQPGTRASLYFKGEEETSAIAVNCIRSGSGCAGSDYRDKSLTTEHGMQLRLCQCDMGLVTLANRVMLDDLSGISISGKSEVHILAAGDVRIEGTSVTLSGAKES